MRPDLCTHNGKFFFLSFLFGDFVGEPRANGIVSVSEEEAIRNGHRSNRSVAIQNNQIFLRRIQRQLSRFILLFATDTHKQNANQIVIDVLYR